VHPGGVEPQQLRWTACLLLWLLSMEDQG
jgi:hypothetical protein